MNITEFLELSAGKWFSQRTIHNFSSGKLLAGKSTLTVEILPPNDSGVIDLCDRAQVNSSAAWGGLKTTWDGTSEGVAQKQTGSILLVPVTNSDQSTAGQLLQERVSSPRHLLKGHYSLGSDQVLTLVTESADCSTEERLWYLIPNLRLRTTVIKSATGLIQASFCSEIRLLDAQ
ncbi:MAG: phycobiliprotein lyase [Microcoleaceae cyanobacterium]